ncbi:hypothetical protein D6833_08310, partial [Candidatus Parcubacteria bacterium]
LHERRAFRWAKNGTQMHARLSHTDFLPAPGHPALLRTGQTPDGRQTGPKVPWPAYTALTDMEVAAIWLKSTVPTGGVQRRKNGLFFRCKFEGESVTAEG